MAKTKTDKPKPVKMSQETKLEDLSQMSLDLASCKDIPQEQLPPKPKQYLLLADEMHMTLISRLMPGLLFVQVEGLSMKDSAEYMLLVNPVSKPKK